MRIDKGLQWGWQALVSKRLHQPCSLHDAAPGPAHHTSFHGTDALARQMRGNTFLGDCHLGRLWPP